MASKALLKRNFVGYTAAAATVDKLDFRLHTFNFTTIRAQAVSLAFKQEGVKATATANMDQDSSLATQDKYATFRTGRWGMTDLRCVNSHHLSEFEVVNYYHRLSRSQSLAPRFS